MATTPIVLNPLDAGLDVELREGGLIASQLSSDGFGYLWTGVRGSVGLWEGKAYFKVRVLQPLPVNVRNTADLSTAHMTRVGVSWQDAPVGLLGEVRRRTSRVQTA